MRIITLAWADNLRTHIHGKKRGYQAQMARDTGCSESMINRIKGGSLTSSEWVEVLALYAGIPIPPIEVDEADSEILALSAKLTQNEKHLVVSVIRGLLSIRQTN